MMTKSALSMVVRGRISVLLLLVQSVTMFDSSNALDPFPAEAACGFVVRMRGDDVWYWFQD